MEIERKWCMPSRNTFSIKPIKDLLINEVTQGIWLDPFANSSNLSNMFVEVVTNDLNPQFKTDYNMDALPFLKQFPDNYVDGVLFDPPYSVRQVSECYKGFGMEVTQETTRMDFYSNLKNEISRVIKPGGTVICFGWNSMGLGKRRGFTIKKILLVAHGSSRNDTICVVEQKCHSKTVLDRG